MAVKRSIPAGTFAGTAHAATVCRFQASSNIDIGSSGVDADMATTSLMPLTAAKQRTTAPPFPDLEFGHWRLSSGDKPTFSPKKIRRQSNRAWFALVAGALAALLGAVALAGWWFHIDAFKVIIPG